MDRINLIPLPKEMSSEYGDKIITKYGSTNAGKVVSSKMSEFYTDVCKVECMDIFYGVVSIHSEIILPELPSILVDNEDGFRLVSDENGIYVISASKRGVLYGWQLWLYLINESSQFEESHLYIGITDYPDTNFRAFHMDMRYGFPTYDRMLSIIDELSQSRFNTFIIEYENRFPFSEHPDVSDPNHYTMEQILGIIQYAEERYINIIPLQQTIGHLEYLLKLPQYNHLREVRNFTKNKPYSYNSVGFKHYNDIDEICASNEEAYSVVESMLKNIIAAHKSSCYVHLGCDEAWNLLTCPDCINRFGKDGKNKLYIEHINRMAKIVLDAGKIPIIWDDMLRDFSTEELIQIDSKIVIMIWLYYESNYSLAKKLVQKYKESGFKVLGAAASKCGEGPEPQYLDMPWYSLRMGNVDMWGSVCDEEGIDGFCMTTWSNYSGTIAPPHPFFDTIWYPVLYSCEKLWNTNAKKEGFDKQFISYFFGVDSIERPLQGGSGNVCDNLHIISKESTRHHYEAKTMYVMSLLSIYRMKALAIGRELYRLDMDTTKSERQIILNRVSEVNAMREELEPLVREIISTHYNEIDVQIFLKSRFYTDSILFNLDKLTKEDNVL